MASFKLLPVLLVALYGAAPIFGQSFNITSPVVTNWGQWGPFQSCPAGRYAQGFQLKTEPNRLLGDDTALNAIRLFCGEPYNPDTAVISSTEGPFGDWGKVYSCYPGVLNGFQLRSEKDLGDGDDTAANNIRFYCSQTPGEYIQGDGLGWGDWTSSQFCFDFQGICGISTQVEPNQDDGDDTSLNNVLLECCDYNAKEFARLQFEESRKSSRLHPKLAAAIIHPAKQSDATEN